MGYVADELDYCPDCKRATAVVLDHATGDSICMDCGLVLESHFVDDTSEWRTFSSDAGGDEREPCRVGAAADPFFDSAKLGTPISYSQAKAGAAADVPLALSVRRAAPDKALVEGFRGITEAADRVGLAGNVRDRAKELYKKVEDARLYPRRNRDALYVACLYLACRLEGKPRMLKELSPPALRTEATRLASTIMKGLGYGNGHLVDIGVVQPADYTRRFCSLLGMQHREVHAAHAMARQLEASVDLRRKPDSAAAAMVYMVSQRSGSNNSIREVSKATGIAESTIREAYKDLCLHAKATGIAESTIREAYKDLCLHAKKMSA